MPKLFAQITCLKCGTRMEPRDGDIWRCMSLNCPLKTGYEVHERWLESLPLAEYVGRLPDRSGKDWYRVSGSYYQASKSRTPPTERNLPRPPKIAARTHLESDEVKVFRPGVGRCAV